MTYAAFSTLLPEDQAEYLVMDEWMRHVEMQRAALSAGIRIG